MDLPSNESESRMILFIRHGKPTVTARGTKKLMSSADFNHQLDVYDRCGLDRDWNQKRVHIKLEGNIISSDLLRAMETATLYTGLESFPTTPLLREVPLPRFQKSKIILPPIFFMAFLRIAWYMKWMPAAESPEENSARVKKAADLLENKAASSRQLLVFSHGFFLWRLMKEMKLRGWISGNYGHQKYLEIRTFTKSYPVMKATLPQAPANHLAPVLPEEVLHKGEPAGR